MNYELAVRIYEDMKNGDDSLRAQVFQAAIRYSTIRAEWYVKTTSERADIEQQRTAAHNTFIDTINILSRSMGKNNQDNEWRRLLTDDRKIIGDFACLLTAHLGILAR